jgi:hypothetical protein
VATLAGNSPPELMVWRRIRRSSPVANVVIVLLPALTA